MSEKGNRRREWVKTAAIVFLSIMLVLTFFSQTIMNYSLPEVSTQYVQSGTITAKIRGTGVVESGDPYEIIMKETRKVTSVAVRVGDTVQKGDVLALLEETDSTELKDAKAALENAKNAYETALLTANISSSDISAAGQNISAAAYRQQITNAQNALKAAQDAAKPVQESIDRMQQLISDCSTQISYEQTQNSLADQKLSAAGEALTNSLNAKTNAAAALTAASAAKTAKQGEITTAEAAAQTPPTTEEQTALDALYAELADLTAAETAAQTAADAANAAYAAALANKEAAQKAVDDRRASQAIVNVSNLQAGYEMELYNLNKQKTAADAEIAAKQSALDELMGKINNISAIEEKLQAIRDAQARVNELEASSQGTEVKSDIAGTIASVNIVAGNTINMGTAVFVIQPEGKGCTLSFSVTNDQAKRLAVGDRADLVNAWRYDDVTATLASIKPDRNEPGQKKLLTFDLTGNVLDGQSLSLSVGQKSANFDLIVPNSAIREDANGKFILTVEAKSSPLGNRYIATRTDVEVLASDDRQSAISGALYGWEYVIINATKPVEAGQQVRLSDNQ